MARLAKAWLLSPEAVAFFRIEPSWLSCRLPVIFRLRRVLRLYEQRIIGKKGLPQQPLLAL